MNVIELWKRQARRLKRETYVLYLAMRDPRVPWYARALAVGVVAYAFSPIDLIPDFIPVLGYLDDLILVPLGVALVRKLIPQLVLAECRERADAVLRGDVGDWAAARVAAVAIVVIWLLVLAACVVWLVRLARG